MQDNELGKIFLLLFLAWILYSILPYVIAALVAVSVILIVTKIQKK
jgi:hypothetical protein